MDLRFAICDLQLSSIANRKLQIANSAMPTASRDIIVSNKLGLHARPAAVVAAVARQFTSDIRLIKGDREANARSVVSIMALEVGRGETVTIAARGDAAPVPPPEYYKG